MSKIALTPDASGTGTFTIASPNSNTSRTLTLPDASGEVIVVSTPTASISNTVTTKIPVVVNGVTYYLLASISGV